MKNKYLLLLLLLLVPVITFAKSDVVIKDVEFVEKSDSTILRREDDLDDTNLNLDYKFNIVDDYVKYKVTIVNNSDEEYLINKDSKEYQDDYVTYFYEFEEEVDKIQPEEEVVLYVTAKYDNSVDDELAEGEKFVKDLNINVLFSTKETIIDIIDNIVNPETKDMIHILFVLLILSMLFIVVAKIQKRKSFIGRISIMILVMIIPFIAKAVNEEIINFNLRLEIDKRATIFLPGDEVNTIFKQLANNNSDINHEQFERNVTKIVRVPNRFLGSEGRIVSTDYSLYEIWAWYYDGKILYYSEDPKLYMNENANYMFSGFENLTSIDLESIFSDRTINYNRLFYHTVRLASLDVTHFNTEEGLTMRHMFCESPTLTSLDVSSFDTSNVVDMSSMFDAVYVTSLDLSNFDVRNVKDISFMFNRTVRLTDLTLGENFNPKSATNFTAMFQYSILPNVSFVRTWDMSSATDIKGMFNRMYYLETLDGLETWDVSNVTDMQSLFNINLALNDISAIADWDVSNVKNMASLFWTTPALTDFSPLQNWVTSSVTDMSGFAGKSGFTDFTVLKDWDVSHVTTFSDAFIDCATPTLEGLEKWDVSSVEDMNFMFSYTDIKSALPIKDWNVSNVKDMGGMFSYTWLTSLDGLEDWNVTSVTNFGKGVFFEYEFGMFEGLNRLTDASAINDWEISPEASFEHMFKDTSIKPEFTNVVGTWNSEGTFIPE